MTDNVLNRVHSFKCFHGKFQVNTELGYVECGKCGEHLNPMWVLGQLCRPEEDLRRSLKYYEAMAETAKDKNRCKCEHCGKLTKIHKGRPDKKYLQGV
jgi:uncharacterized protein (UPF0212 family)